MANLDTRSKRASSVGILLVSMLAPPLPDATIGTGDKQHIAWSYSGIAAATVVDQNADLVYWVGSSDSAPTFIGSSQTSVHFSGSSDSAVTFTGRV